MDRVGDRAVSLRRLRLHPGPRARAVGHEAIINALVAAQTMVGRDGNQIVALPHDRVRELLRAYNRLQ